MAVDKPVFCMHYSAMRTHWLALPLLLVVVLSGCADDSPTVDPANEEVADAETCDDVDLADAPSEPVLIRAAHGVAAEEPFWLMTEDPGVTEHQGSWYELERHQFRGIEDQLTAYQAGEVDASVVNPFALVRGTAAGALDVVPIITIMRDGESGHFSTMMLTLDDSDVRSLDDLVDHTVAINDTGSLPDFLTRAALADRGHDVERDVTYVIMPFPTQEDALREEQADVIIIPEPFYTLAHANGGLRDIADSGEITGFAFDLLVLGFDRAFVSENLGAVCAFRDDYGRSLEAYEADLEAARSTLAATDLIPIPEEIYQQTGDYARPTGGAVDIEGLTAFMEQAIELGILDEEHRIDPADLVWPGVTAGH
jgi:ABC-type nitrate/sulfonate/bicarbonate transport system substrate-binding protein